MTSRWSPQARLELVAELARRTGHTSESIFDAHGLGIAYRRPGESSSKQSRINSALHAAQLRGDVDDVLDAIKVSLTDDPEPPKGEWPQANVPPAMPMANSRQRQVLQIVWDLFFPTGQWPTFREADLAFDRRHDADITEAAKGLPIDLLRPPTLLRLQDDQPLSLTVAGAAACTGSAEDLGVFLDAVRLAAVLEREQVGKVAAQLTSDALVERLSLPAAGRAETLARVGRLLQEEPWGWSGAAINPEDRSTWQFTIGRRVRRLRSADSLAAYWAATREDDPVDGGAAPISTSSPDLNRAKESVVGDATGNVFLVHGHDLALHEVARFLERVLTRNDVVVLSEQASKGQTVIEKFETYSEAASFAVVLLTPDDVGRSVLAEASRPRARQNVVFELGYFYGKLGRHRVAVLNKGGVEHPSDVAGVVYIAYPEGDWKFKLAKELSAAGLSVDLSSDM